VENITQDNTSFDELLIVSPYDFKRRLVNRDLACLFERSVEEYLADNRELIKELNASIFKNTGI